MSVDSLKPTEPTVHRPSAGGRFTLTAFLETCTSLLTVAMTAPLAGLTTHAVQRMLLAAVLLDLPLQFDVNLANRQDAEEFGGLGGYNISVTTIALALLYLRWAILLVVTPGHRVTRSTASISRPLIAYLVFAALSATAAVDVSLALRELFLLLQMFLLYAYFVSWVRTDGDFRFVVFCLLAGLIIESALIVQSVVFGQLITLPGFAVEMRGDLLEGDVRASGSWGSPVTIASYLSFLIGPALAVLLSNAGRMYKALAASAAGMAAFALVLTQTRGAWLSAVLAMSVLWLASARRGRRLVFPAIAVVLLVPVSFLANGMVVSRFTGDDQGSAGSRIPLMRTAGQMIRDHSVLGVGPNNYATAMREYGAVSGEWGDWVFTVHNKFLLVWAETGIGGLVAFVLFLITTIRIAWKGWKLAHPWRSPLALGFAAAIIGQMLHMQVDIFHSKGQVQLLWIGAALVMALSATTVNPRSAHAQADGPFGPTGVDKRR